MFLWLILPLVVGFSALLIYLVRLQSKREEAFQAYLRDNFHAVTAGVDKDVFRIHRGTCTVRVLYYVGKHPYLNLLAPSNSDAAFEVTPETLASRAARAVGLSNEAQTGDRAFDDGVYVDTEKPEEARRFFDSPAARAAVLELFKAGCTSLELDDRVLTAKWEAYDVRSRPLPAFMAAALDALAGLAVAEAGALQPAPVHPVVETPVDIVFGGAAAAGLLFIAGFLLSIDPIDKYPFFLASLRYSLPLGGIFAATAVKVSGRGSHLPKQIGAILLIAFLLIPLAIGVAGLAVNARVDSSPSITHRAQVYERRKRRHKKSFDYLLEIDSWRAGNSSIELDVSESIYDRTAKGRWITVTTKAGYFGYEWAVSVEPEP